MICEDKYIYCKKDHFVQENGGKKELMSGDNRTITIGNKRKSIHLTGDNEYKKQQSKKTYFMKKSNLSSQES